MSVFRESCRNSFRLTLERIKSYIEQTLEAIEKVQKMGGNSMVTDFNFDGGLDFEEREDSVFIGSKKSKIDLADMDYVEWRAFLQEDLSNLNLLLSKISPITPARDSKLRMLIEDIEKKVANPINEGNRKVIIFTAFSDTAQYLYENLALLIKTRLGLNTALVTGDVEARSTLRLREKLDFNKVLTLFSPV